MAIINVVVPQLSESVSEATLLMWKKSPGAIIEADEVLTEIETDKIVLEVPSPCAGLLIETLKKDNSTVVAGEVIARVDTNSVVPTPEKYECPTPKASPDSRKMVSSTSEEKRSHLPSMSASPSASKILADKGISIGSVEGTGRNGRITKEDALSVSMEKGNKHEIASSEQPCDLQQETRSEKRISMSRLRARIAERLLKSQQENAILTTFNEVDMSAIINLRRKYKESFEKQHDIKLGFTSFFVKAAVTALKKYPILNASVDNTDIIYHNYFDIGVAVSTPRGLVVPILRNAEELSIAAIERSITNFNKRAGDGKLTIEELTGGTFSISNGGVFGSMLSTPIINPPQSAILGIHATKERPVVEKGNIVVRPMNYIALSYDHRIIDGREAVLGLVAIKEALEEPQRLLLDL